MADTLKPTTDSDFTPPPADTGFQPAAPLKDAGVKFDSESSGPRQTFKDGAQKLTSQATDKARVYAEDGKAKASGALDQLSQMLTDAAGTVDEKLGSQYGSYARSAAEQVSGFSETIRTKSVDDLLEDARELVRKSPAAAIGTAAALGFVLARVLSAGLDPENRG